MGKKDTRKVIACKNSKLITQKIKVIETRQNTKKPLITTIIKNEVVSFSKKRMEIDIMLHKISWVHTEIYYMFSLIYTI
jgi:hypothetical protein